MREHGTRAKYVVDKCRCQPCRDANVAIEAERRRAVAYGTWAPYVDAEPARQHVRALNAGGLGNKRIAALAGVPHGSMAKLIYGDPQRGMGPSKRIRPRTAAAILAIPLDDIAALGTRVPVDATQTWRRIHSLMALGYSRRWIACQIAGRPVYAMQLGHTTIGAGSARAVKALYDRIGDTPASISPESGRARNEAARNGWPVPAAWDDTDDSPTFDEPTIIDEIAVERAIAGEHLELTADERLEVTRRMLGAGHNKTEIARVLHVSSHKVDQLLAMVA